MPDDDRVSARALKLTVLVLLALIVANPAVLFLAFGSYVVAGLVPIGVVTAVAGTYLWSQSRLATVYLLNGFALVSLFMHAEVVFRYRFPEYVIENLYDLRNGYYFNKPLLQKSLSDKEFHVEYLTNTEGFRIGYSNHADVSYSDIDWLFLGDSYTQGAQVQFEELYTTLLYRRFPDRIIANVGISGFGIPEELRFFEEQGADYKPDIVFLQLSSFNDFMKVNEPRRDVSDHLVQHSDFIRFLLQNVKYQNPEELPLGRWTEPFYPTEEGNRDFNVFYTEASESKRRDLQQFEWYLARFVRAVRQSGAEPVLILLPTKEQIRFRYLEEVVTAFGIDLDKLDMDLPNRLAARLADSLGVELLDVRDEFQVSPGLLYFEFDEHLTPRGHEVLAGIVERYLINRGLSNDVRVLSTEYSGDRYPMVDATGSQMAYHSWADGNTELFLADIDLSSPQRLTFNDVDEAHPSLFPTGDRLVFTEGDAETGLTDVALMNSDGSGRVSLTPEASVFGAIPTVAPGGDRVAYAEWRADPGTGELSPSQIVVLELSTGQVERITGRDSESWRPVFSRDGRRLAYISKVDSQYDVFITDLETGERTQVTESAYDEWDPQFSWDNSHLVYAARASDNWDLFVVSLSDRRVRRLTVTRGDEWDPSFVSGDSAVVYGGEYGVFRGIYRLSIGDLKER